MAINGDSMVIELQHPSRNELIMLFPNSEILFDFSEGSSGVFKDPSGLLLGSRRVAVGGGGIVIPV